MKLELLKELGLSQGQISVYQAVLELGTSSLNKIQEKTGIERRNIYDILNKLIEKGLVSYIVEKGKKTYQCTHPNKILEEIKQKEGSLKELKAQVPQIKDLFNLSKSDVRAEIFRGDEGIKAVANEILDYKECFFIGGNWFNRKKEVSQSLVTFFNHWMIRRAKKKIMMRDLVDHGTILENIEQYNIKQHKKLYFKYRELPEALTSPMVIWIYGNKVAQIIWGKQPFAFVLESKEVKNSFMKYFYYFWEEPW